MKKLRFSTKISGRSLLDGHHLDDRLIAYRTWADDDDDDPM